MKYIKLGVVSILSVFLLCACSSSENESKTNYSSTNSSIKEIDTNQKAEFATIAEKHIKEIYAVNNIKMDLKSINVTQFPDDTNAETGEVYKNVFNGVGDFTWQDKQYNFSLIYSKKDDTNYTVLYLHSNLDSAKGIDTPLESDK